MFLMIKNSLVENFFFIDALEDQIGERKIISLIVKLENRFSKVFKINQYFKKL